MSVVKEGKLKFFKPSAEKYVPVGSGGWVEVNARLLSNAVFEYDDKKIEIGPFMTVTPSARRANFTGVFVFNTKEESSYDSGPIFAGNGEEGVQWMRMINYIRLQNTAKAVHDHPLTQMSAFPPNSKRIGPSVLTIESKDFKSCSVCNKSVNPKEGYCCEFCNVPTNKEHHYQCSDCYKGFKAFEAPFISTPYHNHQLMKIPSDRDLRWCYMDRKFDCSKCSKKVNKNNGYHCVECDQWTECGACASASKATNETANAQNTDAIENNAATMKLALNLLQPAMKVEGNKYSLNNVKAYRCPQAASIITNNYWNLSKIDSKPADNAYFEVTFNKIKDGHVSVGVGNQIFVQNQMLGYQQNSFGYMNNGDVLQNIGTNVQHLEEYTAGDTIGCGILLDSYNQRHVFYTKNGQIVGVFKGTLHRGMDCFPGVSFMRTSMVEFVANFEGPFKFDLSSIPNYRNDQQNRLEALPTEILSMCLAFAVKSKLEAAQLTYISKQCRDAARSNEVWKRLFLQTWPLQSAKLKIKSWYTLYKRRHAVENPRVPKPISTQVPPKNHFIENCELEFECPLVYEKLTKTDAGSRHCNKCQKTVYEVSDEDQLREFSEMGRCVAFVEKIKTPGDPGVRRRPLMGSIRAPPPKIPPPFQN